MSILKPRKYIQPAIYANLPPEDQDWYAPEYEKWKVKKVRNYQNCNLGYDHFMGWEEERTPLGEPYRYARISEFEHILTATNRIVGPMIDDELNNANMIMNQALGSKKKFAITPDDYQVWLPKGKKK